MARIDQFIRMNSVRKGFADYVLAYDLSAAAERRRIVILLKRYGFRVQLSVFECRLTRRMRTALIEQIEKLRLQSGHIRMYRKSPLHKVMVIGNGGVTDREEEAAFIV